MSKSKGVSGKTHTKQQLDDYANQHNPNNKAYQARKKNETALKKKRPYIEIPYYPDFGFGWNDD